jgi:hypothetical protein
MMSLFLHLKDDATQASTRSAPYAGTSRGFTATSLALLVYDAVSRAMTDAHVVSTGFRLD